MAQPPRRSLSELLDNIELVARNHAMPREHIITLCNEARRTNEYKWDTNNPIKVRVHEATQTLWADENGIAHLPPAPNGAFMRATDICELAGLTPSHANLVRVSRALQELGYVRMSRTRIYPSSRWFMPRALI